MNASRKPTHPGAANWIDQFRNITSFEQFETNLERFHEDENNDNANNWSGEAFEVLSEWYILYKDRDIGSYWARLDQVPQQTLDQINLESIDDGVDSLCKSISRDYYAYQSKFRSRVDGKRPMLSWSQVSNFFGQTEHADIKKRIIFTNCDRFAKTIRKRPRFYPISGADLDRLTPEDWANFNAWLEGAVQHRKILDPKAHQQKALTAVLGELQHADCAKCISACGTGKTLIEHLLIERWLATQPIKNAVIFVPTLGLAGQTIHKFRNQTGLESYKILGVGSDDTIVPDFLVTTDPEAIKQEWLKHLKCGYPLIVVCTYNSAATLGKTLNAIHESVEIAIFDEAHKTVTEIEAFWANALQSDKVPIKKRAFFTATEKVFRAGGLSEDGTVLKASMNNEALFGRKVFDLPTTKAIREGLCSDFRILVSVISEHSDLTVEEMYGSDVIVNGERMTGGLSAQQQAILNAVEQFNIKKVFAFDSTTTRVKEFVQPIKEGEPCFLPGFECYYVTGDEHTFKEREKILRFYGLDDKAMIASVKTMIEGIDAPDAQLCVFNCRKKSASDIQQMIGRVLRFVPGKMAYVLLSIHVQLNRGESLDEALDRADFSELRALAAALQSGDPDASIVEIVASRLRIVRSRGPRKMESGDDSELTPAPLLEDSERIKAIESRLIDEITPPYKRNRDLLITWYNDNEHSDWAIPHGATNTRAGWLWNRAYFMRLAKANGTLPKDIETELTALGFPWGLTRADRNVDEIIDNYEETHKWPTNKENAFMRRLRAVAAGTEPYGDITEAHITRLRQLGCPLENPQASAVEEIVVQLETHYKKTNSWDFGDDEQLKADATRMRGLRKGIKKSKHCKQSHFNRLTMLDFPWEGSRFKAQLHAKGEKVSEYLTATGDSRIVWQAKGVNEGTNVLEERLECACGNHEVWAEPATAKRMKTCSRKCPIEQAAMRARVKKEATVYPAEHKHKHLTAIDETRTRVTDRGRNVLEQKFICDCGGEAWIQPSSLKDRTACSPGCSYAKAAVAKARTESAARRRALAAVKHGR